MLQIDVDALADEIRQRELTYVPRENANFVGFCIKPVELPRRLATVLRDQDMLDLLLEGRVSDSALWASVQGGPPYVRERALVERVLDGQSTTTRAIVVHSDMGNGKTIALSNISLRAIALGYSVYRVERRSDSILRELNEVIGEPGPVMLVVEEYPEWLDIVQHFASEARGPAVLLLSARTSTHDVAIDRLVDRIGDASTRGRARAVVPKPRIKLRQINRPVEQMIERVPERAREQLFGQINGQKSRIRSDVFITRHAKSSTADEQTAHSLDTTTATRSHSLRRAARLILHPRCATPGRIPSLPCE